MILRCLTGKSEQDVKTAMSLYNFWIEQAAWSEATFGPGDGIGALRHLKKECDEAIAKPDDLEEYADMMHLVFDATRRAGFTLDQLVDACHAKLQKNKQRKWGPRIPGQPCEHLDEGNATRSDPL